MKKLHATGVETLMKLLMLSFIVYVLIWVDRSEYRLIQVCFIQVSVYKGQLYNLSDVKAKYMDRPQLVVKNTWTLHRDGAQQLS